LILVGGPNGSGKSTFIREFLTRREIQYLCADEVAFELGPHAPETVAGKAGRIFLQRVEAAREAGTDIIVESTLSGKTFRRTVQKFRDEGYSIQMIFVTPLDVEENVRRVDIRVEKGGHSVPEQDIRRRFQRAHQNFWELYRPLADHWHVYVNLDRAVPAKFARGKAKRFVVKNSEVFDKFCKIVYISN